MVCEQIAYLNMLAAERACDGRRADETNGSVLRWDQQAGTTHLKHVELKR